MTNIPLIEASLFLPGAIDEETLAHNREVEAMMSELDPLWKTGAEAARQAREEGNSVFGPLELSPHAISRTIQSRDGEIDLRIFKPDTTPKAIYFHIHGGGWVLGGNHHQDPRLEKLAQTCAVTVVSVDYRLAPEHPYPAGPDDCEDALIWVIKNAANEFGTELILVGGESAGAHLSVVTMLRLRDRHGYDQFGGANLVYGIYDLNLTPSARSWGERMLVLNTASMDWFAQQFLPEDIDPYHPDLSPLYADLSGLGPALFTIGTEDPLLDDSLFMAARWSAAGNPATLAVYPGGAHAFDAFDTELANQALSSMHRFIDSVL